MFTTGEFSKIARVTRRTLRHYRDIGLFEPVEVGADSGYHYYTMEQLPQLQRILALRELAFRLEQIQRLVGEAIDTREIRGMLQLRKAEIEQSMIEEQRRIRVIESRLQLLEQGVASYEVVVKSIAAAPYYSATFKCDSPKHGQATFVEVFRDLPQWVEPGVRVRFVSQMRSEAFEVEGIDLELGYALRQGAEVEPGTVSGLDFRMSELPPAPTAATILMSSTPDLWHVGTAAIGQWVESNDHRISDLPREVWHQHPAAPARSPSSSCSGRWNRSLASATPTP